MVSGFGIGLLLGLSATVILAQQWIVNPAFYTNTTISVDQQFALNIKNMFYVVFGLEVMGLVMALLTFRRNTIREERE